jgi:SPP1 family predicted phage head-tail adaptor
MSKAGELRERLKFEKRISVDDGYGNLEGNWADQFTLNARLRPKLGGEDVLQERLAGRQPFTVTLRFSVKSEQITPEWRAINIKSGKILNIRSVSNPDEKRQWIELMVDEGVAT